MRFALCFFFFSKKKCLSLKFIFLNNSHNREKSKLQKNKTSSLPTSKPLSKKPVNEWHVTAAASPAKQAKGELI